MSDKVRTPRAILSFPRLYKPEAFKEGDTAYYSASLIFTKEAQQTDAFTALKEAAYDAAVERWGDEAVPILQAAKHSTFRTDGEKKGYPEGSVYINVKSKQPPGVVSQVPDPETGRAMRITEEMAETMGSPYEMYPGAHVLTTVNAWAYDQYGNKGVSFWLQNMQKVGEGDRLAGGIPADEEFEADEEAAADLQDLTEETGDETQSDPSDVAAAEGDEPEEKPKKKAAKKKPDLKDLF